MPNLACGVRGALGGAAAKEPSTATGSQAAAAGRLRAGAVAFDFRWALVARLPFLLFCRDLTLRSLGELPFAPAGSRFRFPCAAGGCTGARSTGGLADPSFATSWGPRAGLTDGPCGDDDPVAGPELDEVAADKELGADATAAVGLGDVDETLAEEAASEPTQLPEAGL
jgi:hypothetical protein